MRWFVPAIAFVVVLCASVVGPPATAHASVNIGAVIPYSAPDLVNPLRGQYENLGE